MAGTVQPGRSHRRRLVPAAAALPLWRRFAPALAPQRGRIVLAAAAMVGASLANLLVPWPTQLVVDQVLLGRPPKGALSPVAGAFVGDPAALVAAAATLVVVFALLRGGLTYVQNIAAVGASQAAVTTLRAELFERLMRLSLRFHRRHRSGDLLMRLTGDIAVLRDVLVPALLEGVSHLLFLVGMLGMMLWIDPWLALIALAAVPLFASSGVRFGAALRGVVREQRKKEGRLAGVAGEALGAVAAVQSYSIGARLAARFARQNEGSSRAGLRSLRLEERTGRTVEVVLAVATAAVLVVGAQRALLDLLTPGELVVFLAYLRGINKPIAALVRIAGKLGKAAACGERIVAVLDSADEVRDAADAIEAPPLAGRIEFEDVTFGYDAERPVLRGVSFSIAPGERVGLVGPSGAGKSTVLALLLRLYEPQSGRILVDGTDIRRFRLEGYRQQLGVVLQEPSLFGIAVAENIRAGRPDAGDDEVRIAAVAAEADPFIAALPEGYATVLGERGASLSRGQQQRIALARALVRRAPVLLFDEPTTGLDARTEREVVRTLGRVAETRTCLWVAHGADQIERCPRLLVVHGGRIVADGPTADVLGGGSIEALLEGSRS